MVWKFCFIFLVFLFSLVPSIACVDECSMIFDTMCFENKTGYYICTGMVNDSCLIWKPEFFCIEGYTCVNGSCVLGNGETGGDVSSNEGSSGGGSRSSSDFSFFVNLLKGSDDGDSNPNNDSSDRISLSNSLQKNGKMSWILIIFVFLLILFICFLFVFLWVNSKRGKVSENEESIESLLKNGEELVSEGKKEEARGIYDKIIKLPLSKENRVLRERILKFYNQLK